MAVRSPRSQKMLDLIVLLEMSDKNHRRMDPEDYRESAAVLYLMVRDDLGCLPMRDFHGRGGALETTAENIYFAFHGGFANYDAKAEGTRAREIYECLFARMQTPAIV